jgi:hypothetical protein
MTGIYTINSIVAAGLFGFSTTYPGYYGTLSNNFIKNMFISSTAMLGTFVISLVAFLVAGGIQGFSERDERYRERGFIVEPCGLGLSIKF